MKFNSDKRQWRREPVQRWSQVMRYKATTVRCQRGGYLSSELTAHVLYAPLHLIHLVEVSHTVQCRWELETAPLKTVFTVAAGSNARAGCSDYARAVDPAATVKTKFQQTRRASRCRIKPPYYYNAILISSRAYCQFIAALTGTGFVASK